MTTLPNLSLLFSHPAHFLSLGFGSGLSPKAPGTVGTLVGFPLFFSIAHLAFTQQLIVISAAFILGIWCCDQTGKALGVPDHGSIVWDEIAAMMLVLTFTPGTFFYQVLAFALFRLFDIWKPYPIRNIDAKVKGGLGVMLDDLLAAVYAIIALQGFVWLKLSL